MHVLLGLAHTPGVLQNGILHPEVQQVLLHLQHWLATVHGVHLLGPLPEGMHTTHQLHWLTLYMVYTFLVLSLKACTQHTSYTG